MSHVQAWVQLCVIKNLTISGDDTHFDCESLDCGHLLLYSSKSIGLAIIVW